MTDTSISVPPMIDSNKEMAIKFTILCWNCDSQLIHIPIGIPENIENDVFSCYGNFVLSHVLVDI